MAFVSMRTTRHFAGALACAALLSNACAGRVETRGNAQQSPAGSSGSVVSVAGGGASNFEQGGAATIEQGGTSTIEGGATSIDEGGATSAGASTAGGSGQTLHCDKVNCPAIPTTCKRIVQGPSDCCPTCPDTGCSECPELSCDPGAHSETAPGDCCPSCVPDPPDACSRGQQLHVAFREALFDKYSSSGCKNSTECALLTEDNACAYTCNIALPAQLTQNFVSNLLNYAQKCSTCPAPPQLECDQQIAACVNGKCVAAAVGP